MPSRRCWNCARRWLLDARFCPFCLADLREGRRTDAPEPESPESVSLHDFLRAGEQLQQRLAALAEQPLSAAMAAAVRAWQQTVYFLELPGRPPPPQRIEPGMRGAEVADLVATFRESLRQLAIGDGANGRAVEASPLPRAAVGAEAGTSPGGASDAAPSGCPR